MVMINGSPEEAAGMSILEYLERVGFDPKRVVVEQNLVIIPREEFSGTVLKDDDSVEILRFVGGG